MTPIWLSTGYVIAGGVACRANLQTVPLLLTLLVRTIVLLSGHAAACCSKELSQGSKNKPAHPFARLRYHLA
jgi:hypothetical protein